MLKIFSAIQTKEIDAYTIENEPIVSVDLMERAAKKCTDWLMNHFDRNQEFKIFCGPGNNGGDGLAVARQLIHFNYKVNVYLLNLNVKRSIDCVQNLERLQNVGSEAIHIISSKDDFPQINHTNIVVDALFGSGLNRKLENLSLELIDYLNYTRASKVSIDIPSGLFSEEISSSHAIFRAHNTLTFEFPFLSFLFAENESFVGCWHILEIGLHKHIINQIQTPFQLLEVNDVKYKPRPAFGHKGTFGHALIIAGQYGMAGASILSSKACLRAGCGLVTLHTCKSNILPVQSSFPEVIVSADDSENELSSFPNTLKYDAIAMGPGIGISHNTRQVVLKAIENTDQPVVLDADALNCIAENKSWLAKLKPHTILTPHPGEFDRLFGHSGNSFERIKLQIEMAQKFHVVIVLKGRYTTIANHTGICWFNSTGNNGMATAGSGDVLTGIIVSLRAQGYEATEAAITGVYLHGLAGNLALKEQSHESLIASDLILNLGNAFKELIINKI